MTIEIICREIIKPSSPTSSHLHTYHLSEMDLVIPKFYIPLVLFYRNNDHDDDVSLTAEQKAIVLKKSLSQSLTKYYLFAGRFPAPTSSYVDCNDEGVVFVEARSNSQMDTIQRIISNTSDEEVLDQFFADDLVLYDNTTSINLLAVQLTHFTCGGLALAISFSHSIGDFCTLSSFISHWASVARYGSTNHPEVLQLNPHFIQFPPTNQTAPKVKKLSNLVLRKYVFPNSKLSELKKTVGSINNPTRVEVLTSLLYKTIVAAATTKSGCFNPSYLFFLVNLRDKLVPKLSQSTVGNLTKATMIKTMDANETSMNFLVSELRKKKLQHEGIKSMQDLVESAKSFQAKLRNEEIEIVSQGSYRVASLCGYNFNKLDFGWGKPVGINHALKCVDAYRFVFMDTVDGDGIEVVAVLDKECSEIFENDKEILSYRQI